MSNRKISFFISLTLAALIVSSVLMCILWLPNAINHLSGYVNTDNGIAALRGVCYTLAIPLFTILCTGFYFAYAVYKNTVFHKRTALLLRIIGIILLCDCCALACVNIWLASKGEGLISPALIFVSIIGLAVSFVLLILSRYVKEASLLKEEADLTL